METISIVAPVLLMLFMGYFFKVTGFIRKEGIQDIKKYITGIAIPVLVFHAVSVAEYNIRTIVIFVIMMLGMLLALLVGYLTKGISEVLSISYYCI